MTIFNIAKLPLGSFRGAEFHMQDVSTEGGIKTVTHEYPGSDNRYVEELGIFQEKFIVRLIIFKSLAYPDLLLILR